MMPRLQALSLAMCLLAPCFLLALCHLAAQPATAAAPQGATGEVSPVDPALVEARDKLGRGDMAGAIAALEPLRLRTPPAAAAMSLLAAIYLEAERPDDVLAVLAPFLEGPQADPLDLFNAARACLALEQRDAAERHLARAVEKAPQSRATLLLAELRREDGLHSEVAELLRPLAAPSVIDEIEGQDAELAFDISLEYGLALVASEDFETAIVPLQRATRLDAASHKAWTTLGEALVELGKVEEAYTAMSRAQELAEQNRQAEVEASKRREADRERAAERLREAYRLQSEGRFEETLVALREAAKLDPADPRPRVLEIRMLVSRQREREALPKVEALIEDFGENPEALYLRGMVHLTLRDLPAAEQDLRSLLSMEPTHLAGMNGLAMLLMVKGEKAEAEALLLRLLEIWPNDELARRNLEKLRR